MTGFVLPGERFPGCLGGDCGVLLCEMCRKQLLWRLTDLEFRYSVLLSLKTPGRSAVSDTPIKAQHGSRLPVAAFLLDTILQVEELVAGWALFFDPQASGKITEAFETLFKFAESEHESLRALLRDLVQACVVLERCFPVELPRAFQKRVCPLCVRQAVVCEWSVGKSPRVFCVECGWIQKAILEEIYAPNRVSHSSV